MEVTINFLKEGGSWFFFKKKKKKKERKKWKHSTGEQKPARWPGCEQNASRQEALSLLKG